MESAFYKIKGDFCKFPSGWAEAGIWLFYHCVNFATSGEFYIYADIQQWYVDVEMVCRSGGDNDPVLVTNPIERIPRIGSFLASFLGQLGQSSTNSQILWDCMVPVSVALSWFSTLRSIRLWWLSGFTLWLARVQGQLVAFSLNSFRALCRCLYWMGSAIKVCG